MTGYSIPGQLIPVHPYINVEDPDPNSFAGSGSEIRSLSDHCFVPMKITVKQLQKSYADGFYEKKIKYVSKYTGTRFIISGPPH